MNARALEALALEGGRRVLFGNHDEGAVARVPPLLAIEPAVRRSFMPPAGPRLPR